MLSRYLFNAHHLEIFDVDELPTHGGSLRIYAKHRDDKTNEISPDVAEMLDTEKRAGLLDPATYEKFRTEGRGNKESIAPVPYQLQKTKEKPLWVMVHQQRETHF